MLLYCVEERQQEVTEALEQHGLKRMNFHFDQQGAIVLMNVANFNNLWIAPYAEYLTDESALQADMLQSRIH